MPSSFISSAGQIPLQRSGSPASPGVAAPAPVAAGTMTLVSATTSSARSTRGRLTALAVIAVLAALATGCGGERLAVRHECSRPTHRLPERSRRSLYDAGNTQGVSCESLGTVDVAGVSREVARCSFSEEKNGSGEMRARGGCFALEDGAAIDVTLDMPADVTCFTKPDQPVAETLEPAAHAGVDAQRAGLQDHAADQLGVDLASCLDRAAGGLLDLRHDRGGLVVGQLESGGQLDRDASLARGRRAPGTRRGFRGSVPRDPSRRSGGGSCGRARRPRRRARRERRPWLPARPAGSRETPPARAIAATASANSPRSRCTASTRPCSSAASKRARAYSRSATATVF